MVDPYFVADHLWPMSLLLHDDSAALLPRPEAARVEGGQGIMGVCPGKTPERRRRLRIPGLHKAEGLKVGPGLWCRLGRLRERLESLDAGALAFQHQGADGPEPDLRATPGRVAGDADPDPRCLLTLSMRAAVFTASPWAV